MTQEAYEEHLEEMERLKAEIIAKEDEEFRIAEETTAKLAAVKREEEERQQSRMQSAENSESDDDSDDSDDGVAFLMAKKGITPLKKANGKKLRPTTFVDVFPRISFHQDHMGH